MEIGDNAFSNCYTLKKVISRIMEPFDISDNVFEGIASNAILTVPEGTKSAYQSKKGWKSFQTIEESVMPGNRFEFNGINYIIGEGNTVSVTQRSERYSGDVVIPSHVLYKTVNYTVTSIGPDAFGNYCLEMTSITIPPTVTSIEEDAFDTCMSLTSVYITDLEAWCKIKFISSPFDNAQHFFLNGKEIVDLVIPDKITSIGHGAFCGTSISHVSLPEGMEIIYDRSFGDCRYLQDTLTIPSTAPPSKNFALRIAAPKPMSTTRMTTCCATVRKFSITRPAARSLAGPARCPQTAGSASQPVARPRSWTRRRRQSTAPRQEARSARASARRCTSAA